MANDTQIFDVIQPEKNRAYRELKTLGRHGSLKMKITKFVFYTTWVQKYVALFNGCVYIFKSDGDKSYEDAFSLFGYNEVSRDPEILTEDAKYPFKICYALGKKDQTRYFSADADKERSEWMVALRAEMKMVHKIDSSRDSETDSSIDWTEVPISSADYFERFRYKRVESEYTYIECPLTTDAAPKPQKPHNIPKPPTNPTINLPNSDKPQIKKKPTHPPSPKPNREQKARWSGSPAEGQRVLVRCGREGSYMLRNSRDGSDVLLVISQYQPRKYKILKQDGRVFIDKTDQIFDSVGSLIIHYHSHPLPNRQTKLKEPYTASE